MSVTYECAIMWVTNEVASSKSSLLSVNDVRACANWSASCVVVLGLPSFKSCNVNRQSVIERSGGVVCAYRRRCGNSGGQER